MTNRGTGLHRSPFHLRGYRYGLFLRHRNSGGSMVNARYLRLLAYLILGLLLGANIVIAHAETIPATQGGDLTYTCSLPNFGGPPATSSDAFQACSNSYNSSNTRLAYSCPTYNPSTGSCWTAPDSLSGTTFNYHVITYCLSSSCINGAHQGDVVFNDPGSTTASIGTSGQVTYSCPSTGGWTLSGSSCTRPNCAEGETRDENGVCQPPPPTCPTGEVLEGGVCKPDCNHPSRDLSGQIFGGSGAYTAGGQLCIGGCTYNTNNGITGCKDGNCTYESQVGAATGDRCTPPQNPVTVKNDQTRTPEEKCISQGQGYVSTGGVITCVGALSPNNPVTITQTSSPTTTTTSSGGGNTTTATQTTTTVDPKTGTVTQTTTTTPSGGGTPTTEQTTQPKDKFCEENPDAALCKNGTFGGTCTTGFICDGDGIQCAIARAKYRENCELFDNATPLSNLGNSLGQGVDPSGDLATFKTGTVVNLPGVLDQTNPYSQAGLSDLVVQIGNGHSVTIPFTNLNYYLELMGHILVALSLLAAGRIVGAY